MAQAQEADREERRNTARNTTSNSTSNSFTFNIGGSSSGQTNSSNTGFSGFRLSSSNGNQVDDDGWVTISSTVAGFDTMGISQVDFQLNEDGFIILIIIEYLRNNLIISIN